MTKCSPLVLLSALVAVGLLLVDFVFAAHPTQAAATGDGNKAVDLLPGSKCVVTAELECEIHEVNEEAVLVTVTAIREADQGVPMLTKLPYANRLFKNVGVGRTEMKVVLSIPRDRIEVITPVRDKSHERDKTPSGLRQEVLELKQLILEFMARLEKLDRRLSKLENRAELRADPTTNMRPLGSRFMVDENGIIWEHGRPVGYWGVNGGIPEGRR